MSTTPANDVSTIAPNATGPDRIDIQSDAALMEWARRFDVSPDQLKEAVASVGDAASDVGPHLEKVRNVQASAQSVRAGD